MFYFRPMAAALLIASASPAMAQSAGYEIKWNDLDLNSAAGRETLERRISGAERQICANAITGSRIRAAQQQKACRAEVRRQVEAKIPVARDAG